MHLVVVHREPGLPPVSFAPSWRTCLREIVFFRDANSAAAVGEPVLEGEAYQLLLEVVCGLRSPMVGETQVMGQFKSFVGDLGADHAPLRKIGQRVLSEARRVSERHLRALGSRSYGGATRKRVADCRHVAVIGTGALATDVLSCLADGQRQVDQWGRRPIGDVDVPTGVRYVELAHPSTVESVNAPAAVIVAAPVASRVVDDVARRYGSLRRVIDLRGERDLGPLDVPAPLVTLADVYADLSAARSEAERHVAAARADIAGLSREYALRDEPHPFGWDDLCA